MSAGRVFGAWALLLLARVAGADPSLAVLEATGAELTAVAGTPLERLALLACHRSACRPIPFQVDERTADGQWVLPHGPSPIHDQPPAVFDANDLLLWMAEDAGERIATPDALPPHRTALAIEVTGLPGAASRWVYLLACADRAPRAAESYVRYDPSADLLLGRRVALGFKGGIPDRFLSLAEGGRDLLDRFKVRARASLVWGLLRFGRNEGDLTSELIGWHAGPIRIIRLQRQRIRLGWGIRSPLFSVYTFFHPDFAELPVALWLNYRPTYFFTDIELEVIVDFLDLRGWRAELPDRHSWTIDEDEQERKLELSPGRQWFALHGPQLTLLQVLHVSDSLAPTRRRILYRHSPQPQPPEDHPGEHPGLGYRIDRFAEVEAGGHGLKSVAYALPAGTDPKSFLASRHQVQIGTISRK